MGTTLLVIPSICRCTWLHHHCPNIPMSWEATISLYCILCIREPTFPSTCLPFGMFHTWKCFTHLKSDGLQKYPQKSKVHLETAKRFVLIIDIKRELHNAVIIQTLFKVYTVYSVLNQPQKVRGESLYPICCSLRPC